jgi:hypothetical protein
LVFIRCFPAVIFFFDLSGILAPGGLAGYIVWNLLMVVMTALGWAEFGKAAAPDARE